MLFKGTDLAFQKLSMVLVASFVFVVILLRPQINEHILPLRLWKDGHDSTSRPIPYNPYPDYNSAAWKRKWRGSYQQCVGPDGALLDPKNEDMAMKGYRWNQSEFPTPIFGSYEAWHLDRDLCVDLSSRYGTYGYEVKTRDGVASRISRNWEGINWAELQRACLGSNRERYKSNPEPKKSTLHKQQTQQVEYRHKKHRHRKSRLPQFHLRTAVILRSTIDMKYTTNDIHNIRAMVMELSLLSGAEYEVILLIDAKDEMLPEPMDNFAMDSFKEEYLPKELRGLAVFFNTELLEDWYPTIDVHEAMYQYFQPQFEMDARYTGHLYHLLEQATAFAKQQPRKHLWERNSYFYIPKVHGTWDEFNKMVDQNVSKEAPFPAPTPTAEIDRSRWGVGEEPDVITWLPQFNPASTGWPMRDVIYEFIEGQSTPRRASPVAMSRLSARVLRLMHTDLVDNGLALGLEMSSTSWALYYGLKSVQIPQPVYHAQEWDLEELNRRANSGEPGAISARSDSIWTWNMHHDILKNMTYMFDSEYSGRLYRAWLGDGNVEETSDDAALNAIVDQILAVKDIDGKLFVDTTTVHPNTTKETDEKLKNRNVSFVAAPVFGATPAAESGTVLMAMAGPSHAIDKLAPFGKGVIARDVMIVSGQPEKATLLKTLGNFLVAGTMEIVGEAQVLAEKSDLGTGMLEKLLELNFGSLMHSSSRRMTQGVYLPEEGQSPWSNLNLGIKDVQHGISCAQNVGARLKVAEVALENMSRAKDFSDAHGGRPLDSSSGYGVIRQDSGLDFENAFVKERDTRKENGSS
ncbi:hypothetical protein LT330_002613 [Penicillium expansum]|nr:hypothetical protein LT330_002613 [Penicillium expansum]